MHAQAEEQTDTLTGSVILAYLVIYDINMVPPLFK